MSNKQRYLEDKLKREVARGRRAYKTKDDFLRWCKEKGARQQQMIQAKLTQANRASAHATESNRKEK